MKHFLDTLTIDNSYSFDGSNILSSNKAIAATPVFSAVNTYTIASIIHNISGKEIMEFYQFLAQFPLLGMHHEIGKKIFRGITNLESKELHNKTILYRARKNESEIPFVKKEMFAPPYGMPHQQRFNTHGYNVLYMTDKELAASEEINSDCKINMFKVKLLENCNMLDITKQDCALFEFCHKDATRSHSNIENAYLVPGFFACCCIYHKITGVIYKNTKVENAKNYVFFNYNENWFDLIGSDFIK